MPCITVGITCNYSGLRNRKSSKSTIKPFWRSVGVVPPYQSPHFAKLNVLLPGRSAKYLPRGQGKFLDSSFQTNIPSRTSQRTISERARIRYRCIPVVALNKEKYHHGSLRLGKNHQSNRYCRDRKTSCRNPTGHSPNNRLISIPSIQVWARSSCKFERKLDFAPPLLYLETI